jgi:hypothetical protein
MISEAPWYVLKVLSWLKGIDFPRHVALIRLVWEGDLQGCFGSDPDRAQQLYLEHVEQVKQVSTSVPIQQHCGNCQICVEKVGRQTVRSMTRLNVCVCVCVCLGSPIRVRGSVMVVTAAGGALVGVLSLTDRGWQPEQAAVKFGMMPWCSVDSAAVLTSIHRLQHHAAIVHRAGTPPAATLIMDKDDEDTD